MLERPLAALRSSRTLRAALAAMAVTAAAVAGTAPSSSAAVPLQQVLLVGNNWSGSADVLRGSGDLARLGRINVVPDRALRISRIQADPVAYACYLYIRTTVGEGHDQLVDDMYATPDGSRIVVSRPSFADVVSLDVRTGRIAWRFRVAGYRSDHMAVSPDGTRVAVSASTANRVHVLDIVTGKQLGSFATGDKPHENFFTKDGRYIINSAIGNVDTALDAPWLDFTKGARHLTVVDARTFQLVKTIDMRSRLDAFGRHDLSNAVRPAVFSPGGRMMWFQVSFFNGVVEYDRVADRITRIVTLPENPATNPDRTTWVNDSRHHGLAINPAGDKLCVAGTMDDYVTVLDRATLTHGPLVHAVKPYWATVSGDGRYCVVSEAGADRVTAVSFTTRRRVLSVPVGDHPQRVRLANIPADWKAPV